MWAQDYACLNIQLQNWPQFVSSQSLSPWLPHLSCVVIVELDGMWLSVDAAHIKRQICDGNIE